MFALNLQQIAMFLLQLVGKNNPEAEGIAQKMMQMAQGGNSSDAIMDEVEKVYPQLRGNDIWKNQRGKSGAEIKQFANNFINSTGILNSNPQ